MLDKTIVKKFADPNGDVIKFVFHFENAIAEAVLYKYGTYEQRTVMCVSVQSGCPVGCTFCGTGKKFIRNLTSDEIIYQVNYLLEEVSESDEDFITFKKFQIMFMSMGEPMLNFKEVTKSLYTLYELMPFAQLLISTIGIKNIPVLNELREMSKLIPTLGLQFSIHEAYDILRDTLIPFKNKLTLREIRDYGIIWNQVTGRQVYLNYCVTEKNSEVMMLSRLKDLFPPNVFAFTFSAICESEEGKCSPDDSKLLLKCQERFLESGYNVRVFDPAGKDTIGGGCGQLWYVQEYFNKK